MLKLNRLLHVTHSLKYSTTTLCEPVCAKDFIVHAEKNITPDLFSYFQSGATNEYTLLANEQAFSRFLFQPRMLCDVSNRRLDTTIMGGNIRHPFGLAPTASHKIVHPDGEIASAIAAATTGTPMIVSTMGSVRLEDVASAYLKHCDHTSSPVPLWFQLFILKDRMLTKSLVQRAEASGFTALVVTVDTPVSGLRYQNLRCELTFPDGINYANLDDYFSSTNQSENNCFANVSQMLDDSLTWSSTMEYLRSITKLPVIVKGVLTVRDSKLAVQNGVQGILVSNHGARQLDGVPPTLECLARIAKEVPSSVELYMDGGIRSGDDILKAVALGAKAVFIGRPILWALSYGGREGVVKLINILRRELDVSLALSGVSDITNVPPDIVVRASEYYC